MQNQFLINGRREACLTPLDRGLAYGDGVFRTFLLRRGAVHCWTQHYRRLSDDCNALGIVCPPASVLLADVASLCDPVEQAVLKIIVTRGEGARGYAVAALSQPNRMLVKSALPVYPDQHFNEGVRLHLCQLRLARQPRLAGIKHLNRLENVLARMEWVDTQIADGLLLDSEGLVVECTMSNLFIRRGKILLTPDLSRCGVAGVTRQRIIDSGSELGYTVNIADFDLSALLAADEVIICNSLYGAWQVRALHDTVWPAGALAAALRNRLEQDDAAVA
jgi:4-amino-4-deoxychorismate lyase